MKIGIIGATGKQGSILLKRAIEFGYDATAIVRNPDKLEDKQNTKFIKKDVFDLTTSDLKQFEVVIDAFGNFEHPELNFDSTKHLVEILKGTEIRLIIVGGAGSLYVDEQKSTRLIDTEHFTEEFKQKVEPMSRSLDLLKNTNDVKWTFFSPAINFDSTGVRTDLYKLGDENVIYNSKGQSYVSYQDYATALIKEIQNKNYINKRFTIVGEQEEIK